MIPCTSYFKKDFHRHPIRSSSALSSPVFKISKDVWKDLSGHLPSWWKEVFLMFNLNVRSDALWLFYHFTPPKRIWFHHLCNCLSSSCRLPLRPPSASSHVVHGPAPSHISSTSLDLLQFVHIHLEPERPKIRYSLPAKASLVLRRGHNVFPWSVSHIPPKKAQHTVCLLCNFGS